MAGRKKYQKKKTTDKVDTVPASDISKEIRKDPSKLVLAILISVISFLLYANTLSHDYTVDDVTVITANKIVQKGFDGIGEIFTTPYRKGYWDRNENMYRPLSLVMFAIEWELVGKQPWLGHLMNVLLYSLTGFLLFYTLALLFSGNNNYVSLAFVVALLFASHPIHTEVVANIKSRDEILAFFFCIFALFSLIKYYDLKKISWAIVALVSFFLALLSKENSITFLLVFPLSLFFFRNIHLKRIIFLSSLFLIPVAIYFFIRYNVLNHLGAHEQVALINNSLIGAPDFISRIATVIFIFGKYLLLLIFPHPLVSDYSYNQIPVTDFSNLIVILTTCILLALIYFSVRGIKPKSIYSFSILYFLVTLSIVSNALILIEATMGERFLYMPSLGFSLASGYFLVSVFKMKDVNSHIFLNKKLIMALALVLSLYSLKTITRNFDWKDNMTLLESDIKNAENSARENYAIGSAYFVERSFNEPNPQIKQHYSDRAVFYLERAVSIWPAYADAYNMLGKVYLDRKMHQKAIENFEKAATHKNWNTTDFYLDYALAFGGAGNPVKATEQLEKALKIDPNSAEAYSNLGLYFTDLKQFDKAISNLHTAIQLKPDFSRAYYNLGLAYAMSGQFQNAVEPFKKAIEYQPDYTDAYNNLGNTFSALGEYNEAIKYYEKVLQIEPNHYKALQNLGITYRIIGDEEKSAFYFNKAAAVGN